MSAVVTEDVDDEDAVESILDVVLDDHIATLFDDGRFDVSEHVPDAAIGSKAHGAVEEDGLPEGGHSAVHRRGDHPVRDIANCEGACALAACLGYWHKPARTRPVAARAN